MPLCSEMVLFLGLVSRPRLRTGHLRSISGSVISARDTGQTALFIHHQSLYGSYSGFPHPCCWLLSGQRQYGNSILTRCQENESSASLYSSSLGFTDCTEGPKRAPFEPLQSSSLRVLSLKTALLLAMASVKRIGDLQALSINPASINLHQFQE